MDTITIQYYLSKDKKILEKRTYTYPNNPKIPKKNTTVVIKDIEYKISEVKYDENLNNVTITLFLEEIANIWNLNI